MEGYLYHITYAKDLASLAEDGLLAKASTGLGIGGYAGHSSGHNFFTEGHGIDFWVSRMQDHANDRWDDLHQAEAVPVVLRVWMESNSDELVKDGPGSRDSNSDCYMTPEDIEDTDDIDVWTGAEWVNISDYEDVDWESGLESEEDPDDPDSQWWTFVDPYPLLPPEDSWEDDPVGDETQENPARSKPDQGIYYHATFGCYLGSILENGLGGVKHKNYGGSTGDVCLAAEALDAYRYAEDTFEVGMTPDEVYQSGIVVLEVDMQGLEHQMKIDPNIDDEDPDAYVYSGVISGDRLVVA